MTPPETAGLSFPTTPDRVERYLARPESILAQRENAAGTLVSLEMAWAVACSARGGSN